MEIGKILIVIGAVLIGAGLLWLAGSRLGFGHLPGDIVIERENFRLYPAARNVPSYQRRPVRGVLDHRPPIAGTRPLPCS